MADVKIRAILSERFGLSSYFIALSAKKSVTFVTSFDNFYYILLDKPICLCFVVPNVKLSRKHNSESKSQISSQR